MVHKVIDFLIAGFYYDKIRRILRISIKGKNNEIRTYDYFDVTPEDAGIFAQGLGKSLNYIKGKYKFEPRVNPDDPLTFP